MAISQCAAPFGITIETLTVEYIYMKTRSLGALWAPTSSLGPFGPRLRPSRPSGAQAARPTQVTRPTQPKFSGNIEVR